MISFRFRGSVIRKNRPLSLFAESMTRPTQLGWIAPSVRRETTADGDAGRYRRRSHHGLAYRQTVPPRRPRLGIRSESYARAWASDRGKRRLEERAYTRRWALWLTTAGEDAGRYISRDASHHSANTVHFVTTPSLALRARIGASIPALALGARINGTAGSMSQPTILLT